MSAVTSIAPAPQVAGGRPRRLAVATTGRDDVLVRVLGLLRRRRCRIVAVDFREADAHGPGRFELTVEVPPRADSALECWLLGLVDVVAVSSQ
jgi:acetolactate synthase regulatory subunit